MFYNVTGQKTRTPVSGYQSADYKILRWDATADARRGVAPGVYFARMEAQGFKATRKLVSMK